MATVEPRHAERKEIARYLLSRGTDIVLADEETTPPALTALAAAAKLPSFPDGVGFVSVYSRRDGLVDWHACLDPRAQPVEVEASHIGMAVSAPAYRAIDRALREFAPARPGAVAAPM